MRKSAFIGLAVTLGVLNVSATTYLYDRAFADFELPGGENPWLTLELTGNLLKFTVPSSTTSPVKSVYFTVSDPGQVTATGAAQVGAGLGPEVYNLGLDFPGVGPGVYEVTLQGWDGTLLLPEGGYYSIAEFSDGTWAADMLAPAPVPDAGATLVMLSASLIALSRFRTARSRTV